MFSQESFSEVSTFPFTQCDGWRLCYDSDVRIGWGFMTSQGDNSVSVNFFFFFPLYLEFVQLKRIRIQWASHLLSSTDITINWPKTMIYKGLIISFGTIVVNSCRYSHFACCAATTFLKSELVPMDHLLPASLVYKGQSLKCTEGC